MRKNNIAVVGAGPSGMMAAIRAGQLGQQVTLFEKNPFPGKKLLLSGKGRCNITNVLPLELFLKRFSENGQFLRDSFKKFFAPQLINFFKGSGLEFKTERQLRVFPVTDSSESVLGVLKKELAKNKVKIFYKTSIRDILVEDGRVTGIVTADSSFSFDKVILATGGVSYSFTGSDGWGLRVAADKGHKINDLRPGLVWIKVKEDYPKLLEGLTLKNIRLSFRSGKNEIISEIGEMVFTRYGISGPLVLSLSGRIIDWLEEKKDVYVLVNLKPALSFEQLSLRLLREFKANPKKGIRSIMKNLLPLRLGNLILGISGIDPDKKTNQVTAQERIILAKLLNSWRLNITGSGSIEEGMVTRGGISLKEINPRTMESRLINGLYFCGEIIDIDADTGGFNLQAAFSTGYLAGESAAIN